jgi:hypothetical protein
MYSAIKSICYSHTGKQGAHWDGCYIRLIRCFRSRPDSAGISFPNPLSLLAVLPPMGSFVTSGNSSIDRVVFHLHPNFDILLLWEQDRTLMDAVYDTGIFNHPKQETLNCYRHFKGVHSIGDMVCSDGHNIDPNMLTQEAKQSSRDFPLQLLTGPDHKLWLKMIHSLTQAGHRLHPLGRYTGAPHRPDVWFLCETLGSLFLKVDSGGHDLYTLNQTLHLTRYGTTYTYSYHNTGPCLESRCATITN